MEALFPKVQAEFSVLLGALWDTLQSLVLYLFICFRYIANLELEEAVMREELVSGDGNTGTVVDERVE